MKLTFDGFPIMIIIIALAPNVVSEDTRMDRLFVDQNVS